MDSTVLFRELEQFPKLLGDLLCGVLQTEALYKPHAESWSMLEVVCHLCDEEREDFRQRLDFILHRRHEAWPLIDPETWVVTRAYAERDLTEMLQEFGEERRRSVDWLMALSSPDWDAEYQAPFGTISAGDILVSWVAHDNLHLRQVVELRQARLLNLVKPYDTHYAGEW